MVGRWGKVKGESMDYQAVREVLVVSFPKATFEVTRAGFLRIRPKPGCPVWGLIALGKRGRVRCVHGLWFASSRASHGERLLGDLVAQLEISLDSAIARRPPKRLESAL